MKMRTEREWKKYQKLGVVPLTRIRVIGVTGVEEDGLL